MHARERPLHGVRMTHAGVHAVEPAPAAIARASAQHNGCGGGAEEGGGRPGGGLIASEGQPAPVAVLILFKRFESVGGKKRSSSGGGPPEVSASVHVTAPPRHFADQSRYGALIMWRRNVTLYGLLTCICLLHTGFGAATNRVRKPRSPQTGRDKSFQAQTPQSQRGEGVEVPAEAPAELVNRRDTSPFSDTGDNQAASRAEAEAVLLNWRALAAPALADRSHGIAQTIYLTAPKTAHPNWVLEVCLISVHTPAKQPAGAR